MFTISLYRNSQTDVDLVHIAYADQQETQLII